MHVLSPANREEGNIREERSNERLRSANFRQISNKRIGNVTKQQSIPMHKYALLLISSTHVIVEIVAKVSDIEGRISHG